MADGAAADLVVDLPSARGISAQSAGAFRYRGSGGYCAANRCQVRQERDDVVVAQGFPGEGLHAAAQVAVPDGLEPLFVGREGETARIPEVRRFRIESRDVFPNVRAQMRGEPVPVSIDAVAG